MRLVTTTRSTAAIEDYEYRDAIAIALETDDTQLHLEFCDGEPEDNNLSRNFNDVRLIPNLLRAAYKAGQRGEPLEIKEVESDEL